jgi:hypothetical protein
MQSPQPLGVIGWFLRAFAAGFGVVFGVGSALLLGLGGYLLLAAAGSTMLSGNSPVEVELSSGHTTSLESLTRSTPSYPSAPVGSPSVAPVEWEQTEVTGDYPPHPYALAPLAEQSAPLTPAPASTSLPEPLEFEEEDSPATSRLPEPALETSTQLDAAAADAEANSNE